MIVEQVYVAWHPCGTAYIAAMGVEAGYLSNPSDPTRTHQCDDEGQFFAAHDAVGLLRIDGESDLKLAEVEAYRHRPYRGA